MALKHSPPNTPLHLPAAVFCQLGSLQMSRFVIGYPRGRK